MGDIDERRVGAYLVQIDRTLCVGFGDCVEASREAFELDDEGIAIFKEGIDAVPTRSLMTACGECPVDALTVFDEDGTQLVP